MNGIPGNAGSPEISAQKSVQRHAECVATSRTKVHGGTSDQLPPAGKKLKMK